MFASMYVEGAELVKRVFRSTTIWYMQSFLLRCPCKFFFPHLIVVINIQICVMCISMSMSIDRILLHRTTTLRATFYILSLSSAQFSWANTRCTHQHMPKILTERIHKPNFKDIDTLVFGLLSSSSSTEIRQTNLCRPKPDCAICCFPLFHTHIQSADQFYLLNHAFSQIKTRTRTQISYLMCIR